MICELIFDAKMGVIEKQKQAFRIITVANMSFLGVVKCREMDAKRGLTTIKIGATKRFRFFFEM